MHLRTTIFVLCFICGMRLYAQEPVRTKMMVATNAGDTIRLGCNLLPGSVKIFCAEMEITPNEFTVLPNGEIFFAHSVDCESLRVEFLPVLNILPPNLRHRNLWGVPTIATQQAAADTGAFEANFRTSGSLLRGLRISSGGNVNSTSSLNFSAEGEMTGGVKVSARLADESSPIQPEGNSLELSELDKVLIDFSSPHFAAQFGDVDLAFEAGSFLNLTRRIQGISARTAFLGADISKNALITSTGITGSGFASLMRGIFHSHEFSPQEGVNGPYAIEGTNGVRDITILAGTEKVWLDGKLLRRGEDNDYIIDYNLAQLIFTNSVRVGAKSKVIVDFQFITDDYPQLLYGGGSSFAPQHDVKITVGALFLGADKKNPAFDLTDSVHALLDSLGDSTGTLPAPQALSVVSVRTDFTRGKFKLVGEYAGSSKDENTFSSRDDSDNFDEAKALACTLDVSRAVKIFGGVRSMGAKFETAGRIDDAALTREWNLQTAQGTLRDDIYGGGFSAEGGGFLANVWTGLRKYGTSDIYRTKILSRYLRDKFIFSNDLNYSLQNKTTRAFDKIVLSVKPPLLDESKTDISFELFATDTVADTLDFDAAQSLAKSVHGVKFDFGAKTENRFLRQTEIATSFWRVLEISGGMSGKNGMLKYTHRQFEALNVEAPSSNNSDFIDARCNFTFFSTNVNGSYSLSNARTEVLTKVYEFVGEGEGNYSWDEATLQYIPDVVGDYILKYRPTGTFSPAIRTQGQLSIARELEFFPGGANVSTEANFNSHNKNDGIASYWLNPNDIFTDDSLAEALFSASARGNFFTRADIGITLNSNIRKTAYRIYASGAELMYSGKHSATLRLHLPSTTDADFTGGFEEMKSLRPPLTSWVDATRIFAKLSLMRSFASLVRANLYGEMASFVDEGTVPQVHGKQFSAGFLQTTVFKLLTFKNDFEVIKLTSESSSLPYELSRGWQLGTNYRWNASLTYRAGAKTELSIIYTGEKKAVIDAKHTAEARIRLLF